MKVGELLKPIEIRVDEPLCPVSYDESIIACNANEVIFSYLEQKTVLSGLREDGIPVIVDIIRGSVRSAHAVLGGLSSECAQDIFGPSHTTCFRAAIDQGMSEQTANWTLTGQPQWVIASICMSVALCVLYHQVNDEYRDWLFLAEPNAARLTEAGVENLLVSQELRILHSHLEPFGHRLRLEKERHAHQALSSSVSAALIGLAVGTSSAPPRAGEVHRAHTPSAMPLLPMATHHQPQEALSGSAWPECSPMQQLVDEFCKSALSPKAKVKLVPVSIRIYLHAIGLCSTDTVSDLRLAMARVAASGEPLQKTVAQRSDLYGNLANAGRLRSLNLAPSDCRNLALARKRSGKTVKLDKQQKLERETRWIGWHAFLASQTFAAGALPLPEWDKN